MVSARRLFLASRAAIAPGANCDRSSVSSLFVFVFESSPLTVSEINPDGVSQKARGTIFLVRPIPVIAPGHLGQRRAVEWCRVYFDVPFTVNTLTT